MRKFVVIEYYGDDNYLSQVYVVLANSENEARNKVSKSCFNFYIVIDVDNTKDNFQYFKK